MKIGTKMLQEFSRRAHVEASVTSALMHLHVLCSRFVFVTRQFPRHNSAQYLDSRTPCSNISHAFIDLV